ncbi:MAG: hypothetical protein ACFFBP_05940 [Promethearchaeota archaeon]
MSDIKQEEFQVIVVNPKRCTDCETCMSICSFIHDNVYIPLNKRIIGARKRIELEWAISCDLCKGINENFIDTMKNNEPQCILACPHSAIFLGSVERIGNESRMEAIKRIFFQKDKNQIIDKKN